MAQTIAAAEATIWTAVTETSHSVRRVHSKEASHSPSSGSQRRVTTEESERRVRVPVAVHGNVNSSRGRRNGRGGGKRGSGSMRGLCQTAPRQWRVGDAACHRHGGMIRGQLGGTCKPWPSPFPTRRLLINLSPGLGLTLFSLIWSFSAGTCDGSGLIGRILFKKIL